MGLLTGKQDLVIISYTIYRDQTESYWPGHILEKNMELVPGTKQRTIRTRGHMRIVFPWIKDEDIPKKYRRYIIEYMFSRTGKYHSTNRKSGGRIKAAKKGYRVLKDKNRKAINYQVPANRRKWCWDIHIPYEYLKKAKIKEDPKSMIQEKRDKQPYKDKDMPKKAKVGPDNTIGAMKRAIADLEDIGVGLKDIINEGLLSKDAVKIYLDNLLK